MLTVMRGLCDGKFLGVVTTLALTALIACAGTAEPPDGGNPLPSNGGSGSIAGTGSPGDSAGSGGTDSGGTPNRGGTGGKGIAIDVMEPQPTECPEITCAGLGYACGRLLDECGNIVDCADEGLTCGALEACSGGGDNPTQCVTSLGEDCAACAGVPDCSAAGQLTRLTGRVVTAGKDDANAANQLGVPNAFVYILRTTDVADLPAFTTGIPEGGTSCDRCADQDLGPVLVGALTDATGSFTLEGNIPVGMDFLLVVKAGRFRRATLYSVPEAAACMTTALPTALPENPTRLPRNMTDGLAVNIPRIAVSTGESDAMECVLAKMGIALDEFANPGADGSAPQRVHLYRGGQPPPSGAGGAGGTNGGGGPPGGQQGPSGARLDDETPHDRALYGDLARLQSYDIVVADCEGGRYDSSGADRQLAGDFVREYANRGGRMFASHLEFTWLHQNGEATYDEADPIATGLASAATWPTMVDSSTLMAVGAVSIDRPQASPRIQNFADWMMNEGVTMAGANTFNIIEPRSQNPTLGPTSEEFVYEPEHASERVEQFSVNTPVGAPEAAVCGRIAYSGFHVSAMGSGMAMSAPNADVIFPEHCVGDLSAQEKVLLYMLFDLNACIGEVPPPPECTPATCESLEVECGFASDGCGNVLDCGPCVVIPPR